MTDLRKKLEKKILAKSKIDAIAYMVGMEATLNLLLPEIENLLYALENSARFNDGMFSDCALDSWREFVKGLEDETTS